MLQGFIARHAATCLYTEIANDLIRFSIENHLLPAVIAHRKRLDLELRGARCLAQRRAHPRYREILADIDQCRRAVRSARRRLTQAALNDIR